MKRPVVTVTVAEPDGTVVHTETRAAFNAGITASEAAVRAIARAEGTTYEAPHPHRDGGVYRRLWTSARGRILVATVTKEG